MYIYFIAFYFLAEKLNSALVLNNTRSKIHIILTRFFSLVESRNIVVLSRLSENELRIGLLNESRLCGHEIATVYRNQRLVSNAYFRTKLRFAIFSCRFLLVYRTLCVGLKLQKRRKLNTKKIEQSIFLPLNPFVMRLSKLRLNFVITKFDFSVTTQTG